MLIGYGLTHKKLLNELFIYVNPMAVLEKGLMKFKRNNGKKIEFVSHWNLQNK